MTFAKNETYPHTKFRRLVVEHRHRPQNFRQPYARHQGVRQNQSNVTCIQQQQQQQQEQEQEQEDRQPNRRARSDLSR